MIPLNTPLKKASIWKQKGMVDFHDEKNLILPHRGHLWTSNSHNPLPQKKEKHGGKTEPPGETGDGRNPANHLLRER